MHQNTELISKSIKVPKVYDVVALIEKLKSSAIATLRDYGDAATNLIVYGEKKDGLYIYLFDLYQYPNFTNIVDVSYKVMDDITSSKLFNRIVFVCFQASIKYHTTSLNFGEIPLEKSKSIPREAYQNKAILFLVETARNKNVKMIYIKDNQPVEVDDSKSIISSAEEHGIPKFKKYLKNNEMATSTPTKENSIWDRFSIKKEEFDWIDDILNESKKEKRSLTDTIKIVVRSVRNHEFEIDNNSVEGRSDCSSYEIKLFLAGKIFEEKLKSQI